MFTSMDSIGKASLMLDLVSQRQRALGSNLANMDTPGYVRKDVDFGQYLGSMNSPIETKLSQTLGASGVIEEREHEEINPAQELMAIQQNTIFYSMATRRMSNIITEMKTVINVGK